MTEHSLWRFSRVLHRAISERQFRDIAGLLDEDVDWAIHGPIDMFPFLGARRGSAAVLEVIRQIAILTQPVMPSAAEKLLDSLGIPRGEARTFATLGGETRIAPGTTLPAPQAVFPRYIEPTAA